MKHFLLLCLILSGINSFAQVTKKSVTAKSTAGLPGSIYAVAPANATANSTSVDTTYLSSADFSGTGTVADPIRIKMSAVQTWLQSLPGYINNGSKYLASDFSWKTIQTTNALTPLSTPVLTATVLSSSGISLSWTNVDNESSYLLQRSQDNFSWTTIATPLADITQQTDNGLTASTLYYYRVKAVGDNISYSDGAFGSDSKTTSPPNTNTGGETILFNLATAYGIQQHPDGPGTYFSPQEGGIAQAEKKIAAGTDGLVYFQYLPNGGGDLLSLGYTTTNAVQGYEYWTGGVYMFGNQVKMWGYYGSSSGVGANIVNNNYYGFRRSGGVIEIVTSADKITWTALGQANYTSGDLYVQMYIQTSTSKIKVFGQNLVSY